MGSLSGHLLPGSFFLLFGLWWTWSIFTKYFLSLKEDSQEEHSFRRRKINLRYKNTVTFPCITCHRVPVEGIIKVAVTTVGIIGEFVTAFKDGEFVHFGNVQHLTMYFFFGLNGVVDILTSCKLSLVPDLDYATGILAYFMEGILFLYHLDGQDKMEVRVHIFLVYLVFASAISSICEMLHRSSVLAALCRVFFTLLQGTWFYQIGFILYVNQWNPDSPNQMKTITFVFTWHFGAIFLFLLVAGYIIKLRVKHLRENVPYNVLYSTHSLKSNSFVRKPNTEENSIFTDSEEL